MPTPDRMPHPPGPPTMASILADHEAEKRRQQRPVSKSTGAQSARGSTSDNANGAPDEPVVEDTFTGLDLATIDAETLKLDLPDGYLWAITANPGFQADVTPAGDARFVTFGIESLIPGEGSGTYGIFDVDQVHDADADTGPYSVSWGGKFHGYATKSFYVSVSAAAAGPGSTIDSSAGSLHLLARWLRPLTRAEMA